MNNHADTNEELIKKIKNRQIELRDLSINLIEGDEQTQHNNSPEWIKMLKKDKATFKQTAVLNYG